MAYRGQFDHLVREADRGRAIAHTRTIVVFDDGLVVCAVAVYGDEGTPVAGILGSLRRAGRAGQAGWVGWAGRPERALGRAAGPGRGHEQVRMRARAAGSVVTFGPAWPGAWVIPLASTHQVLLTRPRQVSELAIKVHGADPASAEKATYLGDLSPEAVRDTLGPVLGERLRIAIPQ